MSGIIKTASVIMSFALAVSMGGGLPRGAALCETVCAMGRPVVAAEYPRADDARAGKDQGLKLRLFNAGGPKALDAGGGVRPGGADADKTCGPKPNPPEAGGVGPGTGGGSETGDIGPGDGEMDDVFNFDELFCPKKPKTPRFNYDKIKPNEIGDIPIVMLHGLTPGTPPENYMTSIYQYKVFLKQLYDDGFRMANLNDVLDNNIRVKAGCSPVVFTFDDGMASAFSLKKQPDGSLAPAKDCAVGIMESFEKEHPDFGHAGTFYINGDIDLFKGDGTMEERFRYLVDHGYELGNHTYSHVYLNRTSEYGIEKDMARLEKYVHEMLPGYRMRTMAYPYGSKPSQSYKQVVLNGSYDGVSYHYDAALREKPIDGATAPNNKKFNPLFLPRVRASDNEFMDLGWYLKTYRKNPSLKYISDGDPDTISVPVGLTQDVNMDSFVNSNKTLNIYTE